MKTLVANDVRNAAILEALHGIADANAGYIDPLNVVNEAENPESPLHDYFTWDEGAAAKKCRIAEAQCLLRRFRILIVRPEKADKQITLKVTETRKFQSRPSARNGDEHGYEHIVDIMSDSEKRAEMVAQVTSELLAYRKRYSELSELAEVWNAIDNLGP